jgi:hypothetical protein
VFPIVTVHPSLAGGEDASNLVTPGQDESSTQYHPGEEHQPNQNDKQHNSQCHDGKLRTAAQPTPES